MLAINNLHASIQDEQQKTKNILRGINLTVKPGEVHAIMGPNGSGKSTLANILAGRDGYQITACEVKLEQQNILELAPEQRAAKGLFLAFQYPVEIPGVNNMYFLKAALNSLRKSRNIDPLDAMDFLSLIKSKIKEVGLDEAFLNRAVNEGFSGGEKKRNEVLQMLMLEPKLAILDETDSGLDIDALQMVAKGVNTLRSPERSFVIVTHYQRLLNYIVPDVIHVMVNGQIIKSGGKELALELEEKGYGWLEGHNSI
jgi:Fe-S cluster assembly ATP-binding protein